MKTRVQAYCKASLGLTCASSAIETDVRCVEVLCRCLVMKLRLIIGFDSFLRHFRYHSCIFSIFSLHIWWFSSKNYTYVNISTVTRMNYYRK